MGPVTVGIDIGTTSVKAVVADEDGRVVARARVPHDLVVPDADRLEHRPEQAWRDGVRAALAQVTEGVAAEVAAVNVAAMVPSLAAVDGTGVALGPGLLYGDTRAEIAAGADPSQSGELVGFLRWCASQAPHAAGFWPAQAMANHALGGEATLDTVAAMTAVPLFDYAAWDPAVAGPAGASVDQLPRVVPGDQAAGRVDPDLVGGAGAGEVTLGPGTVDAFAEQLVAGADRDGDVLVILGATLISWAVIGEWREVEGLWTIPHAAEGRTLIGGPSNAGGLFLDWAHRLTGITGLSDSPAPGDDAARVPVWAPYVRGERVPLHDPHRRAALADLDLTHDGGSVLRAAHEAGGFVIRHQLELAGLSPTRIVATGGGIRSPGWLQAIADGTGLPVDVVAVPEGGALGAAFLARVTAGLEASADDARRWARVDHRVEPDPAWVGPVAERYDRFRQLTDAG